MKEFSTADRLKQIMRDRNLKQVDILRLAKPYQEKYHISLGKSSLSQYLSGYAQPGPLKLFVLGEILNVSEAWLMGYDVPMERNTNDTTPPGYPKISTLAHASPDNSIDPATFAKLVAGGVTVSVGDTADDLWRKISQLDEIDRAKIEAYTDGLLAAEKYQEPTHQLKIAARGGGVKEITVTDSQLQQIIDLPEVTDLDDKN